HRDRVAVRIHDHKMTGSRRLRGRIPAARHGELARRRRRAGMLADQLHTQPYVGGIEQALHRHRYEARIGNVAVTVGVDETTSLREQEPGLRVGGTPPAISVRSSME